MTPTIAPITAMIMPRVVINAVVATGGGDGSDIMEDVGDIVGEDMTFIPVEVILGVTVGGKFVVILKF